MHCSWISRIPRRNGIATRCPSSTDAAASSTRRCGHVIASARLPSHVACQGLASYGWAKENASKTRVWTRRVDLHRRGNLLNEDVQALCMLAYGAINHVDYHTGFTTMPGSSRGRISQPRLDCMAYQWKKLQRWRHQRFSTGPQRLHRTWEENHHVRQRVHPQIESNDGSRPTAGLHNHLERALPPRVKRDWVILGDRQDEVPNHPDAADDGYEEMLVCRCDLGSDVKRVRDRSEEVHPVRALQPGKGKQWAEWHQPFGRSSGRHARSRMQKVYQLRLWINN